MTLRDYKSTNHRPGKALDNLPHARRPKPLKCSPCGNAIARAICVVCYKPLCRRHTATIDVGFGAQTYCKDHVPGYDESGI